MPAQPVIQFNGLRGVSMVSHSASLYEIWKKDSFISTQWQTKRALSLSQISQVTLKTNKTVLLHGEDLKTSQWLITVLEDLGAVGEMASVALHSSHLAIWSTRKWHTFLLPSNKINPNPSSSYCCTKNVYDFNFNYSTRDREIDLRSWFQHPSGTFFWSKSDLKYSGPCH